MPAKVIKTRLPIVVNGASHHPFVLPYSDNDDALELSMYDLLLVHLQGKEAE